MPMTRRNTRGTFVRRTARRMKNDHLIFRAQFLPEEPRALLLARIDRGLRTDQLATLQKIPLTQLRRRLLRLREILSDPSFLLAARFGARLPEELRSLAAAHWVEGRPLRQLARERGESIHAVRAGLATTRAMLLLVAKNETNVGPGQALRLLEGKPAETENAAEGVAADADEEQETADE